MAHMYYEITCIIPLPDMPILGSFNSTANKDMMLKNVDKWGCSYLIGLKT